MGLEDPGKVGRALAEPKRGDASLAIDRLRVEFGVVLLGRGGSGRSDACSVESISARVASDWRGQRLRPVFEAPECRTARRELPGGLSRKRDHEGTAATSASARRPLRRPPSFAFEMPGWAHTRTPNLAATPRTRPRPRRDQALIEPELQASGSRSTLNQ